jgi:hypothetical protein
MDWLIRGPCKEVEKRGRLDTRCEHRTVTRGQGAREQRGRGDSQLATRLSANPLTHLPANSPAALLREELARRTDDLRIVAELLGVPVEDVKLGPNLIENGGFGAWKGGKPKGWAWSPMFSRSPFNQALFEGKGVCGKASILWGEDG